MISDLTRHQLYIQRWGNGIYRDIEPLLIAIRDKLLARVSTATPAQLRNIEILLADIEQGLIPVSEKLFSGLYDFAEYENTWTLKLIDSATIPAVTIGTAFEIERIKALIDNSTIKFADKESFTVMELFATFSDRFQLDVKNEIELGLAAGETTDVIAKRIKDLTHNRTSAQAKAVVLTAANHAGNVTRSETFAEYGHLFEGEEYVAVLDSKTSPPCFVRDGGIWSVGEHKPLNEIARRNTFLRPPLHFRCRSLTTFKLKPQYALGGDTTRASKDGQVSAKLTYGEWLKGQSKAVQYEVLGKTRAEAFRAGTIQIDRFVDNSGHTYTLEELRKADLIK